MCLKNILCQNLTFLSKKFNFLNIYPLGGDGRRDHKNSKFFLFLTHVIRQLLVTIRSFNSKIFIFHSTLIYIYILYMINSKRIFLIIIIIFICVPSVLDPRRLYF